MRSAETNEEERKTEHQQKRHKSKFKRKADKLTDEWVISPCVRGRRDGRVPQGVSSASHPADTVSAQKLQGKIGSGRRTAVVCRA